MPDDYLFKGLHLFFTIQITCRIIGIADNYSLCSWRNYFFEFLHRWECKTRFYNGGDRFYNYICSHRKSIIICIKRFRYYYLITSVKTAHKSKQDRFTAAGSYNDLVMVNIYSNTMIILNKFSPVRFIPCAV